MPRASVGDDWAAGAPFRFVLPREKRARLAARVARLRPAEVCPRRDCHAESLAVLVVETEQEAVLCPVHCLVLPDGSGVRGEPTLVTATWWPY